MFGFGKKKKAARIQELSDYWEDSPLIDTENLQFVVSFAGNLMDKYRWYKVDEAYITSLQMHFDSPSFAVSRWDTVGTHGEEAAALKQFISDMKLRLGLKTKAEINSWCKENGVTGCFPEWQD